MDNRDREILAASQDYLKIHFQNDLQAFVDGAEWADRHPSGRTAIEEAGYWLGLEMQKKAGDELIKMLQETNDELINALKEIANEDYRGNRSSGSVKAYHTLKKLEIIE